ncbi:MAG: hypothetical protein ABMB14_39135 [Myxococcota bacterium]
MAGPEELDLLLARVGTYGGHGINHEDQPFHGELAVESVLGRGVRWTFRATGIDGTTYHEEQSWVARDETGALCLWSVNGYEPHCGRHVRRHGAGVAGTIATLVFGRGDPGDPAQYRIEIAMDLWPNGDVGYRYAWGLPNGPFEPRSAVRMALEVDRAPHLDDASARA